MKIIRWCTNIVMLSFFSLGALAASNHLEQAIQHTEAAISAVNGPIIAENAGIAIIHAKAAKKNADQEADIKKLDDGIKFLEDAVKQGNESNSEAAKKSAMNALDQLIQFEEQ